LIPVAGKQPAQFHGLTLGTNSSSSVACSVSLPKRKSRRIEVVGDSISCGFGNEVANTFAQHTECTAAGSESWAINRPPKFMFDATSARESYAAQLASRFEAEIHLQCISGIGICKNGVSLGASDEHNMSRYVDRTLPFDEHAAEWDYKAWQPDLLVINLGTNDYLFRGVTPSPPLQQWEAAYTAFVTKIMAHYSVEHPKLLLMCGPMTDYQCDAIANVATKLSALGMTAVFGNASLPNSPKGLSGCAGHPNATEVGQVVARIAPVVQQLMGW